MYRNTNKLKTLLTGIMVFSIGIIFWLYGPVGLLKVTSGSMEPAIKTGKICFVNRNCDFNKLKVGDVVVFFYSDKKACHRIVRKEKDAFVTKGDANESPDVFLLTKNSFYGKVLGDY